MSHHFRDPAGPQRPADMRPGDPWNHRGVVLLITLVILVILATLGYTLTGRVAARRHRDQYIVAYGQTRYACASALKYALVSAGGLSIELVSRPNEPDFSDIFAMSEVQYQEFLAEYERSLAAMKAKEKRTRKGTWKSDTDEPAYRAEVNDVNDVNDGESLATSSLVISGPYGPRWPLVTEPIECEIGSAKVTIEIEDENAKYPLSWPLIAEEKWKPLAGAGFTGFCEWMGYTPDEIVAMRQDLARIGEMRPFQLEFKATAKVPEPPASLRSRVTRPPSPATPARATPTRTVSAPVSQMEQQAADFGKLFHSSLIDADLLSRPSVVSESRTESAMKYLGLWATRQVNINTAPRHVLEAAFAFGNVADAPRIAEEIIRARRVKPFADIEEAKKSVFRYSDSIENCKDFLTTTSTVFTIKVTAISGVAKTTIIAAVTKDGDKVKQIGIISD